MIGLSQRMYNTDTCGLDPPAPHLKFCENILGWKIIFAWFILETFFLIVMFGDHILHIGMFWLVLHFVPQNCISFYKNDKYTLSSSIICWHFRVPFFKTVNSIARNKFYAFDKWLGRNNMQKYCAVLRRIVLSANSAHSAISALHYSELYSTKSIHTVKYSSRIFSLTDDVIKVKYSYLICFPITE